MDNSRQLKQFEWALRLLSVIIIFIGSFWLIEWLSGTAVQQSSYGSVTGRIIMKANMSLALLLSGLILFLMGLPGNSRIPKLLASLFALIILAIGSLTLIENIFNFSIGIDQLLASEPSGAAGTMSPNRIGLPGSLSLTFLGAGFLLLIGGKRKLATLNGLIVCVINLVPASGYLLNIGIFYSNPRLTAIAWPTVCSFNAFRTGAGIH